MINHAQHNAVQLTRCLNKQRGKSSLYGNYCFAGLLSKLYVNWKPFLSQLADLLYEFRSLPRLPRRNLKKRFHSENASNVFSSHYPGEISPVFLDLRFWCLRKTYSWKSRDYCDFIVFEKLRFQNVFSPHENEKPAFSNSCDVKSVFEKLGFRDGLVWKASITIEINPRFQFFPAQCGASDV